jgi:hypothetical protein
MKGTIIDFLKLATEKPELAQELVALATKHDFEFSDEVSDADLDAVAGGGSTASAPQETMTGFEDFDQKANQLFNILSTVMKSTKEMESSVTRNIN